MKAMRIFGVALIVVLIDQCSKFLVRSYHPESWLFSLTQNTGAAFGMFSNSSLLLGIVSIAILLLLCWYAWSLPKHERFAQVMMGLIIGGGIGNMIDRLIFHSVTDFIDVQVWPVFNVADAAAVSGVIGILYLYARERFASRT